MSLRAIRANRLRSILTVGIIALGITALVGILTAIDSIKISLKEQFVGLGANSFVIVNNSGNRRTGEEPSPIISLEQAAEFAERFSLAEKTSKAAFGDNFVVKYRNKKTNPNVEVVGIDQNYLDAAGYTIGLGRNMTTFEVNQEVPVTLLGRDVAALLFERSDSVIGKTVSIGDQKFKVIGMLASRGSSMVASDNIAMIPFQWLHVVEKKTDLNYEIYGSVSDPEQLNFVREEAAGVFRSIRKLKATEEDDFEITTSEKVINELFDQLRYISAATVIIGLLTLLGAGIGLMNIMLVSVNERTREIGVSKALGARRRHIERQFLIEAITICQIGGLLGVLFGIAVGNIVTFLLRFIYGVRIGFVIPWDWIALGLGFCFVVGLLAGIYPALKAGKLNPVEALRYE